MTPSLFGLQILAAVGQSWVRRTALVIAGSASAFGIACLALYTGFAQLPHRSATGPNVVQGVLFFIAAAVLIGVDLGPNYSVTGSLATILWLVALRREGLDVGAWTFLKFGLLVTTPALLASLALVALLG